VYIFEFKFNKTAQSGLDQIKKQRYADKYRALGKQITGIGVNFDGKEREMNEWIEETL
jgi:PD-(D/E)XK nuclease superfamily